MSVSAPVLVASRGERLYCELAAGAAEIREAQSIRYRVFGQELGAKLKSSRVGLDVDGFDAWCHHLLVRESRTGRVVGCTRLLTDYHAMRLGGFYSAGEFDLGPIQDLDGRKLEVGRTCIDPEFRSGAAIAVLWSGLAEFVQSHRFDYLFGCASLPLGQDDVLAAAMMNRLRHQALSPETLRVRPHVPLLAPAVPDTVLDAPLPPLVRAYVRLGAKACGEPCRDPDFQVADVLMLLKLAELNPTYCRHFLERGADA